MPLKRQQIIAKFSEVLPLTQYSQCYYGGEERLTLKLQKAESAELLESITISFPPLEGEHASKYALIISLFWVCVLPSDTPPADYITNAMDTFTRTGSYDEAFGDVRVCLTLLGGEFFLKAYSA